MTRAQLVERQQAFQRAANGWMIPALGPVFLVLFMDFFGGIDVDRWGYWLEAAAFVALILTLAAVTIVFPRLKERQVRKLGLACPSCGEPLLDGTGRIAAITGRCGTCGHRVAT